jgi:hypothetical protein
MSRENARGAAVLRRRRLVPIQTLAVQMWAFGAPASGMPAAG